MAKEIFKTFLVTLIYAKCAHHIAMSIENLLVATQDVIIAATKTKSASTKRTKPDLTTTQQTAINLALKEAIVMLFKLLSPITIITQT